MTKKYIDGEYVDVVDLTPYCMKYAEDGHKKFMDAYEKGQRIFTMSFTRGITYKVKILNEAEESTEFDPKYDVRVIAVKIDTNRYIYENIYPTGYERWVRTYDLKKEVN